MVLSVAHFRRYNSKFTAALSLRVIVYSKTNARFGISAYEWTVCDPSGVDVRREAIEGHMRSLTSNDQE